MFGARGEVYNITVSELYLFASRVLLAVRVAVAVTAAISAAVTFAVKAPLPQTFFAVNLGAVSLRLQFQLQSTKQPHSGLWGILYTKF